MNQQLEEATSQINTLSKKLEITEREVFLDGLTGLNNRKAFDKSIDELCENLRKIRDSFHSHCWILTTLKNLMINMAIKLAMERSEFSGNN